MEFLKQKLKYIQKKLKFEDFMIPFLILFSVLYLMGIFQFLYMLTNILGIFMYIGVMVGIGLMIIIFLRIYQWIAKLVGMDKMYNKMFKK